MGAAKRTFSVIGWASRRLTNCRSKQTKIENSYGAQLSHRIKLEVLASNVPRIVIAALGFAVVFFWWPPPSSGRGKGDGPGATGADRLTGADLTPNSIVRNASGQVTSPLIEAEIFIVRQKYRRIEEHFDQQPDTAVLLDHQPVARRKHESHFDGRLF